MVIWGLGFRISGLGSELLQGIIKIGTYRVVLSGSITGILGVWTIAHLHP